MCLKWSCKPSSVSAHEQQAIPMHTTSIHLGRQLPAASCSLPGSRTRRATSSPLFGLAPGEVYRAASVAEDAVSSYLTISPLPAPEGRRFVFCGTVYGVTPPGRYPAPCPAELGLSSPIEIGALIQTTSVYVSVTTSKEVT